MNGSSHVAGAALTLLTVIQSAAAVPVEYRFQMEFGEIDGFAPRSHPLLSGANVELIYRLDAATLVPASNFGAGEDRSTVWPSSNTTVFAKITGTWLHNGTFPASIDLTGDTTWALHNSDHDVGDNDLIEFPAVYLPFKGGFLRFWNLAAIFEDAFQVGSEIVVPQPFSRRESLFAKSGRYSTESSFTALDSGDMRKGWVSATVVPEPSMLLLVVSLIVWPLSHRRRSPTAHPRAAC